MRSLLTLVAAFTASYGLTYLFVRLLETSRIVAVENHRSMHKGAVPTGAGWPLLFAVLAPALAFWPFDRLHLLLVAATVVLAIVSWADDLKALSPMPRLAAHVCAAALAMWMLPENLLVFHGAMPFAFDRLVTGLALAWFMNLYNFMDGIDGIAGVETIAIAAGYAAIVSATGEPGALYGLALAATAATAGFLLWNWAPARIFLGDVGSVPLGFLMGVLMVDLAARYSFAAALILPLYFLADASMTIVKRVLDGRPPWEAHRDHAYQRAARGLGAHAPVVVRVALANAILVIAAVLAVTAPLPALVIAVVTVAALLVNLERAALGHAGSGRNER